MSFVTASFIAALALGWTAATYFTVTPPNRKIAGIILVVIIILWFLSAIGIIPGIVHVGR